MTVNPRRDIPIGAAIAVAALALIASVVTGREEAAAPERAPPTEKTAPSATPQGEPLPLDRLVRQKREGAIQDLFEVKQPPAPTAVVAKPAPPPAPTAPPLPFTYLGRITKDGKVIVYLLKNQEMILAEAGQTLEGNYRLEGVSETAIDFVYLPLGTKQVLAVPAPK